MTKWTVKDLSKLTGVSVQTLHHYDRINLLKPALRAANGYRIYSETDLLRLQQIIALKFFGFELSQINSLLAGDAGAAEHFTVQAKLLEQKATAMLDASNTLKQVLNDVVDDKSIPWESILKLIEVYQMTQQLENSWVKDIFSPEELKQYATFEAELKSNNTQEQQEEIGKRWHAIIAEIEKNLDKDPATAIGAEIGKKSMDWINDVYGKKYANLRTKKFEQGFGEGKGLQEVGLTPATVVWMDKAIDTYLRKRLLGVLNQVGTGVADDVILKQWLEVLDEMYGDEHARKKEMFDIAINHDDVSAKAKEWLCKHRLGL